jgi:hypothetical protein
VVTKGAAWAVPAIVVATSGPAVAASGAISIIAHQECKCTGNIRPSAPKTYVFTVTFNQPVSSFTIVGPVVVANVPHDVTATLQVSPFTWEFQFMATSLSNLTGIVTFVYTADGVTQTAAYPIIGTPPCTLRTC